MRLKNIYLLALALALALPGGEVLAQEHEGADTKDQMLQEMRDLYGDEAFITIATGSRKPIYRAPAVASVITAAEIKAMGARSLDEVLETVAGLHVMPSTQGRLDSIYSIRGIHTKFNPQVLVLMNGIPFPHFSGGRPFQFRLPVTGISRIEVIRGPGSAVYGADAYAGVVNIITKEADDISGTEIGGRLGSFDTHDLWLQHGRHWGGVDVAFSLEWQQSEGDRGRLIDSDLQTSLDQAFGTNASLAPAPLDTRYDILNTHLEFSRNNLRLRHWYWQQDDAGLGAGSSLALDPRGGEDYQQHLIDITYHSADSASDLDLTANFNYLHRVGESRFVLLPPGSTVPIGNDGNLDFSAPTLVTFRDGLLGNPSGRNEGIGFDFFALYSGHSKHRWRFGTGIKETKFKVTKETKNFGPSVIDGTENEVNGDLTDVTNTSFVFLPDSSRTAWYLSLQDEWQFARDWELTAGVRYDRYSDFGDAVNPRLALIWATRYNLTTKFLYGSAFRAPAFIEQFSINNPVAHGNPNLSPEKIDTIELSFDYRPIFDLQTILTLFAYQARDLIDFMPDESGATFTAQNARDQDGYGFEFEVDWKVLEKLRLRSHYAWQHSEDVKTNRRIADAPRQQAYFSAEWGFLPGWIVDPQLKWIGSRYRDIGDDRPRIPSYSLLNLTLRRTAIFKHWDVALAVRNLLDEAAREPSAPSIPRDYPLEGRNIWGEISYRF